MKIFIILLSFFAFSLFFALAMNIPAGTIPTAANLGIPESPICSSHGLINIAAAVAKQIYIIFFSIAVIFILFAAFNYLSNAGKPDKIKEIHNQLIYVVVAITVALLALSFDVIIKNFLGNPDKSGNQETVEQKEGGVGKEQKPTQ